MNSDLKKLELREAVLVPELRVTVQCPVGGVKVLLESLGKNLPLKQGAYDHCLYVRESGYQMFRALEGSHAGAEHTVQTTQACEIVFTIPDDGETLQLAVATIFKFGVNEDPTIHVESILGSCSKYLDDKDNPNRYWNRSDAEELHGTSSPVVGGNSS